MTQPLEPRPLGSESRWPGWAWALLAALLLGVLAVAHRAALADGFVRDDFMWLVDARSQRESLFAFWTHRPSGYFRPLSNLWFVVFEGSFGLEAAAFRWGNLLLQVWNACWLGALAFALSRDRAVAVLCAFGFVALAAPSASVDWISGVVSLLCVGCLLPAWALYAMVLTGRERGRSNVGLQVAVWLLAAGALGARETGVLALPGIAAVHLCMRGPGALGTRRLYLDLLPGVLLASAYLVAQWDFLQNAGQRGDGVGARSMVQAATELPVLFARVLDPWSRATWHAPTWLGTLLLGMPLLASLRLGRRGLSLGVLAWLLSLLALLPYASGIAAGRDLIDRYLYELAMPTALLLGLGVAALLKSAGALRLPLAVAVGLAWASWHGAGSAARYERDFHLSGHARAAERFWETLSDGLVPQGEVGPVAEVLVVAPPFVNRRHLECALELATAGAWKVDQHLELNLLGVPRTPAGLLELRERHGVASIWAAAADGSLAEARGPGAWRLLSDAAQLNWRRFERPPVRVDSARLVRAR